MKLSYTATLADNGRKVYFVLKRELALSATAIKRLKASSAIIVNGESVYSDHILSAGDVVEIDPLLAEREPDFLPEDGGISILFENDWLVAVNKPAGMLVHPSRSKYTGTLAGIVAGYLLRTTGSAVCHSVNRLDRDTSGVVLFAKSAHAKAQAISSMQEYGTKKEYCAYLCGTLPNGSGTVDAPIGRVADGQMLRAVMPEGQRAVTRYETTRLGEIFEETVSETRFFLETGRTHQIRVHSSYLGAPILGDRLYGTEKSIALSEKLGVTEQLLHAGVLTFLDPLSGKEITISAPVVRDDMLKVAGVL